MRRLLGSSSRPLLFWGTISLVLAVALAIRLSDPAPVTALRLLAFDSFQRIAPVPAPPPHLVRIVDVDERALSKIGRWPWSRRTLAALVEKLQGAGAAVIAFDFIFPNAERVGPCALPAADLKRYGFLAGCAELEAGGGGDQLLAKAIGGGPVVLGVVGRKGDTSAKLPERAGFALLGDNPASLLPAFDAATQNLSALQAAAAGFGALNWLPQIDQVVRRVPVVVKISDQLVLSLSAEVVRLVAGADTVAIVSATASGEAGIGGETGLTQVRIGDLDVDVDGTGQVWLPFSRSTPSRYISAADVLADTLDADAVRDRIVLIGTSAAGLFDLQATPLDAAIPGVEVHAQAIERLLTGNTLQRPDYAAGLEVIFTALAALLLAATTYFGGARLGAVLGAVAVAAVVAVSWFAFSDGRLLLDPVFPVATMTAVYLAGSSLLYVHAEADRNAIRNAFDHYMAPELVRQLIRQPERLQLGGETRELTLMFSDVRGFTAVAEGFHDNPQGLTALMNRMLTPLTRAIIERRGTVDKYMGDAIMAFWNAPLDDADHARNASEAAIDMIDRLKALNAERRAEAGGDVHDDLSVGVGLATGEAMVGNMGSDLRFDYSVLGDTVNLASRLEGLTRQYGVSILMSDTAHRAGATGLAAIEIDRVRVKGRETIEPIWALVGGAALAEDAAFRAFADAFGSAREAYAARNWPTAAARFAKLKGQAADYDLVGAIALFERRISDFMAHPPPPDWDGAVDMTK